MKKTVMILLVIALLLSATATYIIIIKINETPIIDNINKVNEGTNGKYEGKVKIELIVLPPEEDTG